MSANRTLRYFVAQVKKIPSLTSREKGVLLSRISNTTLTAIGKKYKVTEGRIRQIEKGAIKKIQSKFQQQRLFNTQE